MNHLTLAPGATRGAAGLPEPARMRLSRLAGFLVVLMAATMLLANCGGKQVAVPGVVGLQLDDAHKVLAAKGFEEFEDLDLFDNRFIMLDANWVVLQQDPKPNAQTGEGDKITLRVGKIGEIRTRKALPAGSPVLARLVAQEKKAAEDRTRKAAEDAKRAAQQKAKAAAEQKQRAAARAAELAKEAKAYNTAIDTLAKSFAGVLTLYDENAAYVRSSGGNITAANNALAAKNFFETGISQTLKLSPPGDYKLGSVGADMSLAMAGMVVACDSLIRAIDTGAPSAFASAQRERDSARDQWAATMEKIYAANGRKPIMPPP